MRFVCVCMMAVHLAVTRCSSPMHSSRMRSMHTKMCCTKLCIIIVTEMCIMNCMSEAPSKSNYWFLGTVSVQTILLLFHMLEVADKCIVLHTVRI